MAFFFFHECLVQRKKNNDNTPTYDNNNNKIVNKIITGKNKQMTWNKEGTKNKRLDVRTGVLLIITLLNS